MLTQAPRYALARGLIRSNVYRSLPFHAVRKKPRAAAILLPVKRLEERNQLVTVGKNSIRILRRESRRASHRSCRWLRSAAQ